MGTYTKCVHVCQGPMMTQYHQPLPPGSEAKPWPQNSFAVTRPLRLNITFN